MKKMLFILMVLLVAMPAMAMKVKTYDKGSGVVDVNYMYENTDAQRVRGLGLDVTVATGATVAVKSGSFLTGVSTASNKCFGIFPGTITIDPVTGVPGPYGTPAAKVGSPGAGTGNVLTIEMGSLYAPVGQDVNAPVVKGAEVRLCSLQVTQGTASSPVALSLGFNTARGGVVYEDGTAETNAANLVGTNVSFLVAPGKATVPTPAHLATGVGITTDISWTAGTGAATRDVYFGTANPPVNKVIADGTALTYDTGTMAYSTTYYWRVDEKNSAGTTTGDVWSFTTAAAPKPTLTGTVTLQSLTAGKEVGKVLTIQIYNGATLVETLSPVLASSGAYSIPCAVAVAGVPYDIKFKASHWLKKKVTVTLATGTNTVNASLLNGDVNNDNNVNSTDLGQLKTNYLKSQASPLLNGDLNEDGNVNSTDLGILKGNYLKSGD